MHYLSSDMLEPGEVDKKNNAWYDTSRNTTRAQSIDGRD